MRKLIPAVLLILSMVPALSAETHKKGDVTVTETASPDKALVMAVTIPASVHDVWTAFSTTDGLQSWLAPKARVDLRQGGDWLVIFPESTGGGTITDYKPERRIAIHALAPAQFPTVRQDGTEAVFTFEALDAKTTKLTLRQTGWKKGEEWDRAYRYLSDGNASLLQMLRQRFVTGPTDWKSVVDVN